MKKYKEKVIVCYDGDSAGQKAAARAVGILSGAGLDVKVLKLPEGIDPDEFLTKYGAERFRILLNSAVGRFDYQSGEVLKKYNIEIAEEKIKAADEIGEIIAPISSDVERDVYGKKIADKLGIPFESYKNDIEKKRKRMISQARREQKNKLIQISAGYSDRINPDAVKHKKAANAEEAILGILQIFPEYLHKLRNDALLSSEDFMTDFDRRVYEAICTVYDEHNKFDLSMIAETFTPDEIGRITKMQILRGQLRDNGYDVLKEHIEALKNERRKQEIESSDDSIDSILNIISQKKDKK